MSTMEHASEQQLVEALDRFWDELAEADVELPELPVDEALAASTGDAGPEWAD
jgi:hypothetical protein